MRKREITVDFLKGCLLFSLFLLLFLAFLPRSARADDEAGQFQFEKYDIVPSTDHFEDEKWKVKLSNATCSIPIQINLSAFIGGKEISASVDMSTTMDFEIEFKEGSQ